MKVDPELIMQHGTIGNNYAVEYTANLTTGAWHSITNLALESSSNTWVDVNASGSKGRFYRARPAKLQHFNPPPMTQNEFPVLTIDDVLRDYKLLPVQNDWHVGSIILGSSTALAWSNAAGRVWNLIPDFENQQLVTDETCPYPGQNFQLNFVGGHYTGFHFSGSLYSKVDDVLGDYEKLPVENNWHIGSIISGTSTELAWSNAAGVVWNLIPDYPNQMLLTDETCPYPGHDFQLQYSAGQLAGFYFQGALYSKTGVQVPVFESSSMHGYMGAYYTAAIPEGYNYGFSFYSSICSLLDEPLSGFQIGLPGTWLIPDNRDFFEPLLPPDNRMRMISPSRASNYWRGVFQTIEGGGGAWVTTRFPSSVPKYRMNGSINGYINEVSSPGWGFGQTTALPTNAMGIAQLSNRLLVPPDGLTFDQQPGGEFMGYAWMALPLIPASSGVGDQSWTCFVNAANFKGALAFYVPEIWTRYSEEYPTILGRGLDIRPGLVGPFTMELGAVPMKLQSNDVGDVYARLPRILFPTDGTNVTYLAADMSLYSKTALFNSVETWFSGGSSSIGTFDPDGRHIPPLAVNPLRFSHGSENQDILFSQFAQTAILETPGGGQAFGLEWTPEATAGVWPEYFVETAAGLEAVSTNEIPADILLSETDFPLAEARGPYRSPISWNTPAPASMTNTVTLSDGSNVKYAWYRFVDQPSVQGFSWTAEEKLEIQSRIEQIHATWSTTQNFMQPPTGGVLATLDPSLFVTPPAGLEAGYVPIVIEQSE